MKMLRVYANNEDKNAKSIATKEIRTDYITIAELSKHLGWRELLWKNKYCKSRKKRQKRKGKQK